MRISDWSSDVCSSDLGRRALADLGSALTHYSDPILQKPDASLIPGIAQAVIWLAVSRHEIIISVLILAPLEFPGDIDCLSVQIIDEHDLLVFEPIEPATEFIRASGQVVVALAIHAMSFWIQNIFLLDRKFIVLFHLPNFRTRAEQSKRSEEHTSELQSLIRI